MAKTSAPLFGFLLFFLEELEAVVEGGDDLRLGDAEPRARRDVARAVGADRRVLAEC